MPGKYKHIIWDWNGTLLNDIDLCVDIINGILKKRELTELSHDDYKRIFTFPIKQYYINAGIDFNKDSFEVLGIEWINEYERRRSEAWLFEGAKDILNYIRNSGMKQSVLSAYMHDTLTHILDIFELSSYFTHISGLDHIYADGKIDIGKELVKKIGLDKEEMVLIGDTLHDYEVAESIGTECILIANGHQGKDRLLSCNVPVLDSITDLKEYLTTG